MYLGFSDSTVRKFNIGRTFSLPPSTLAVSPFQAAYFADSSTSSERFNSFYRRDYLEIHDLGHTSGCITPS